MLSDKKFGLTANLLATRVMPTLIPHTVTPGMTLDQVCFQYICLNSDLSHKLLNFLWRLMNIQN